MSAGAVTVASLVARFAADTTSFDRGVSGVMSQLKGLAGMLGVGLTAKGIFDFTKGQLDAADALAKMSDKTGLSVEALSQLQYAADLSGTSIETVTRSAVLMNRALGEGTEKTAEALGELGFSMEQIMAMDADQRFVAIAGALGSMQDKTKQAAIGQAIFGRGFAELLPLIKDGEAGIRKYGEELRQAGGVVTTDFARSSERINDGIARITKAFGNAGMRIISDFAEPVAQGIERLEEPVRKLAVFLGNAFKLAGTVIGGGAAVVGAFGRGEFAQGFRIAAEAGGDITGALGLPGAPETAAEQRTTNQILRGIDAHLTNGVPARAQ